MGTEPSDPYWYQTEQDDAPDGAWDGTDETFDPMARLGQDFDDQPTDDHMMFPANLMQRFRDWVGR